MDDLVSEMSGLRVSPPPPGLFARLVSAFRQRMASYLPDQPPQRERTAIALAAPPPLRREEASPPEGSAAEGSAAEFEAAGQRMETVEEARLRWLVECHEWRCATVDKQVAALVAWQQAIATAAAPAPVEAPEPAEPATGRRGPGAPCPESMFM